MHTWLMSLYVLIWPVGVAAILAVLVIGFCRAWLQARREGRPLV